MSTPQRLLPLSCWIAVKSLYSVCSRKIPITHKFFMWSNLTSFWIYLVSETYVIEKKLSFAFFCDLWASIQWSFFFSCFCYFISLCRTLEGNRANNHSTWLLFTAVKLFCYDFPLNEIPLLQDYVCKSAPLLRRVHWLMVYESVRFVYLISCPLRKPLLSFPCVTIMLVEDTEAEVLQTPLLLVLSIFKLSLCRGNQWIPVFLPL